MKNMKKFYGTIAIAMVLSLSARSEEKSAAQEMPPEGTAYGNIPCAMAGYSPGSCFYGVKREANGSGIVTVTKQDGRTRKIFFKEGNATGADTSEADNRNKFSADWHGDLTTVYIGDERYEVHDTVIFGY